MVERCGDRQRKFDGLEKWPFRLFVESLPIMLQIALLLLTCGLSRYMWSVNTSVAGVVISFTVLGMVFYIGIVVAGTSSYECPFQTPASIGLRHLRDSGTTRKLLARLSPSNVISLVYATRRNTRRLVARLSLPNVFSFMYATRVDAWQGFISTSHSVYDTMRHPLSWEVSPSRIVSCIHSMSTKVGHQTIILLLRIDRTFGNVKQRMAQEIRRLGRTVLLPLTTKDANHQPRLHRDGPGLRVRVWNLESLRRRNGDNARCACWVLRNITDPEAIDSDVRLAGTIRWFDGNSNHDPPYDSIVSTFEACFDSTKRPYPGMRDRAYFSARAILQISMRARTQSDERASKYSISAISSSSFEHTDPDLHHVIRMLEYNSGTRGPTFDFPSGDTNTHAHSLWMSNLFVDLTRTGPNPTLKSYDSYLSAAVTDRQPMIANILLVWDIFLGGHVEEETLWAVDKSYAVVLLSLFSVWLMLHPSDSLEAILSHLSITVMNGIADGSCLHHLNYLLEFLAAWEKRPAYLTPMAYQWCSAISEAARRFVPDEIPTSLPDQLRVILQYQWRLRPQDGLPNTAESGFSQVGSHRDPVHLDGTSLHSHRHPQRLTPPMYAHLLFITLDIGFRRVTPSRDQSVLHLDHTSHHEWVFETAFSSDDDDVIADAMCARYLAKRVEWDIPFSPRLQLASIHTIERIWRDELRVSGLDTVRWLNHLNIDADDVMDGKGWARVLVGVIRSPTGLESLSSHHWHLLDKLVASKHFLTLESHDMEVMGSLEKAEDWEKLEVWMVAMWSGVPTYEPIEGLEEVTFKLLSRRPSVFPRLEDLCKALTCSDSDCQAHKDKLQQICDQVGAGQLPSESQLP